MVIRHLRHPEASEPVDMQFNMVIYTLSSKIQRLSIETNLVSPRHPEVIKSNDTWRQTTVIRCFCYPETIKFDSTQRPIWSSTLFIEDSLSIDRDYFSLHFLNQRQASMLTRGDIYGHLLPLSKTRSLSIEIILVSHLLTRGKRAYWRAEKNMVICIPCWWFSVYRLGLLYSPVLPSRDNQVRWRAKTVVVTCFCCSETIKVPFII